MYSPSSIDRQKRIQELYARLGVLCAAELRAAAVADSRAVAVFVSDIEYTCGQIAELTALEARAAAWADSVVARHTGGRHA